MKIIIAVPDFTREAHLKKVLPHILYKLNKKGLSNKDMEILIGTGLHRKPTHQELKDNLGNIADSVKLSSHDYKNVFYSGRSKRGIPIYLDKKLKNAEYIVTIGVVEPHLYAGYSGGVKVISIGLAGEKTINSTHHPRFLDHLGTRICSLKNNLFQNFIQEVSSRLPIKYSVNIINDKNGNILKIFEGSPKRCFIDAVRYSQKIFEKKICKFIDVVICNIPAEKGVNIYQASRIFNYIADTRIPVIRKNSLILVKASLQEGFGKGLGEKRFMKKMLEMKDPEKTISEIRKSGCLAGEHRAYMVAKALRKAKLGFISEKAYIYKNKGLPFLFFGNLGEAKKYIEINFKKPKIHYLKNAFTTILTKAR
ncbi:MAG: lactate racemase domain-containing protein [Candidatus Omnitrophica bacterium]|nr:lactate racemase domain-containing protein [Candidatus Omnitrophota bacterium]